MRLINKLAKIYSYFPKIMLMLVFRLLLYGAQQHHQQANATEIAALPSPSSTQPQPQPTDKNHRNSGNFVRVNNAHVKRNSVVGVGSSDERKIVETATAAANSDSNNGGGGGGGHVAEIFIAVIYPKSKETIFSRVIKQTVSSLSEDFTTATSLRVVPHYTAIADTEGYNIREVQEVCKAWNHKPIIAAVVFSTFKSGFGHVLTSLHNNIPVLWATGEIQAGYFERVPLSRFDVRLDPGSYEVLRSLRSLLLATHWHAFTVMHTTTLLASQVYQNIINEPPLLPTILRFSSDSSSYYIFRLLSDVSKSTKGVIVLICEGVDAKRVIEESKKLNMVNGDFVWLWIDTSAVLIKDKTIRLEKVSKEINFVVESRKVRHAAAADAELATISTTTPTISAYTAVAAVSLTSAALAFGGTSHTVTESKINPTVSTAAVFPSTHASGSAYDRSSTKNAPQLWKTNRGPDAISSRHQNKTDSKRLAYKYFYRSGSDVVVDTNDVIDIDNDNSNRVVNVVNVQSQLIATNAITNGGKIKSSSSENTSHFLLNNDVPPPFSSVFENEPDRNTANAATSFNGLMKHHFLLYRKKNKRIADRNSTASIVAVNVTSAIPATATATTTMATVTTTNAARANATKQEKNSASPVLKENDDGDGRRKKNAPTSPTFTNTLFLSVPAAKTSVRKDGNGSNHGYFANNSKRWSTSPMVPISASAAVPFDHRNRYHCEHDAYATTSTSTTTMKMSVARAMARARTTSTLAPAQAQTGRSSGRELKRNDNHWPSLFEATSQFAFIEKITVAARQSRDDKNHHHHHHHHHHHRPQYENYLQQQKQKQQQQKQQQQQQKQQQQQQQQTHLSQSSLLSQQQQSSSKRDFHLSKMDVQLDVDVDLDLDVDVDVDVEVVKRKAVHFSSQRQSQNTATSASLSLQYDFEVPIFVENNSTQPVSIKNKTVPEMPVGILSLQLIPSKVDKNYVKGALRLLINTLKDVIVRYTSRDTKLFKLLDLPRISCFNFFPLAHSTDSIMEELTQNLKRSVREAMAGRFRLNDTHLLEEAFNSSLAAKFKILNLIPDDSRSQNKTALESRKWRTIGHMVGEDTVHLETIVWPGGDIVPVSTGRGSRSIFRIVTAFSPPFVMIGELDEDGQCLRGIECHQFLTSDKDNLTLLFNEMERTEEEDEVNVLDRLQLEKRHMWGDMDIRQHHPGHKFKTNCCYGLSMDLLENVAEELEFDFQLYIVGDGFFGTKTISENGEPKWNGIMGDLVSGAAHLSFSALSVSSSRAQAIDFSAPYFFSGVSFLAAPKESTDIPLLAFLLPFSSNLWIAIFTSLHVTAAAVAIYEWLSPFGLNPWGRQRSKNFGVASALWVMWGLLCGHLVQFKAPKSWPNKFLINVWGGFSVIFIASYTANIAALIAGLFFHTVVGDHHDRSLLSQRVGAPKASAAEYYVRSTNQILWNHMQRYSVISVAEGVHLLKNGSLDILIADTPILDYYRATDHGCKLQRIGDTINEDTYAIGMTKGFPLKDSISAVIAKYSSNGYMDILQEKWYGGLPCFKLATDMAQPRPLGVAAVAGVFLMLGCGVVIGCLILFSEHLFYKYTLPSLRKKPKSSMWKSRNVMFFSQKLYRFINCVELVSPHHAARELVHTLRQGQITSLFQKSVRRKEHEQRQQQQKSKAQFFEMIQEIRRVQQEERKDVGVGISVSVGCKSRVTGKSSPRKGYYGNKNPQLLLSPTGLLKHRNRLSPARLDFARRLSKDVFRSKSSGNLNVRRISSDMNVAAGRFFDFCNTQAIGRRLSHGTADSSPPDLNAARRASQFFKDDPCIENGNTTATVNATATATATAIAIRSPSTCSDIPVATMATDATKTTSVASDNSQITSSPSDLNWAKSPKSPTSASASASVPSSSVSSNVFSPGRASNSFFSRDIGPLAARKFSNADSLSFRGLKSKTCRRINAPKVIINNEEFLGYDSTSVQCCNDDDEYVRDENVYENVDVNDGCEEIVKLQTNEYASCSVVTAQNNLAKSPTSEHIIEIVIPSSTTTAFDHTRVITHRRNTNGIGGDVDDAAANAAATNATVNESFASNTSSICVDTRPLHPQPQPQPPPQPPPQPEYDEYYSKPKIILHLPPRKTKKAEEISDKSNVATCTATGAELSLQRLSREELVSLLKLSEKELKENLAKALQKKERK